MKAIGMKVRMYDANKGTFSKAFTKENVREIIAEFYRDYDIRKIAIDAQWELNSSNNWEILVRIAIGNNYDVTREIDAVHSFVVYETPYSLIDTIAEQCYYITKGLATLTNYLT